MAHEVSKIIVANKANVIDVIVAANEAVLTLLDDGIAYSLTKYCAFFCKNEGIFWNDDFQQSAWKMELMLPQKSEWHLLH